MNSELIRKLVPRAIRNWLRSPSKSVRYLADRTASALGANPTVMPADDWLLRCHPAAKDHFEVFRTDPVQSEELRSFIQHCNPGMRLLDVGAHYGLFALACIRYSGSDAQVLCVEASPKAASILRSNLRLNDSENRVVVMNCAMGDSNGELRMLTTGPMGGDYFVVPTEQRTDTVTVTQCTLPSLLAHTGFKPTHIKMDIESFEFEVLAAAAKFLKQERPVLFLELHGTLLKKRGKSGADILEELRYAGYNKILIGGKEASDIEIASQGYDCRLIAKST